MITQRAALGASNTVTVGAGDLINASTFASQVQHEEPTIDFLGAVGLQVSSVGNHEFDSGFATLTGRIIPRAHEHGFEYVGANIYHQGHQDPAMKSYEVYTVNGVRVGVVGAVTAETPTSWPASVSPGSTSAILSGRQHRRQPADRRRCSQR